MALKKEESGKSCLGEFKFPKCKVKPCRHECVAIFNEGRKITFVLKPVKVDVKSKKVYKGVRDVRFDNETVSTLITRVLNGIPLRKSKKVDLITWSYRSKVIIWLKRARNQEVTMELIRGIVHPKARKTKKKNRILLNVRLKDEMKSKHLRDAILRWLHNQK